MPMRSWRGSRGTGECVVQKALRMMPTWLKLAAVAVVAVLAASVLVAWRDARQQQAALQVELKTTQQALAEATTRQASRDAAVNDLVAGLKKKEAAVQKPAEAVAALPEVLPLPAPITIEPAGQTPQEQPSGLKRSNSDKAAGPGGAPDGISPKVNFPAADLKPLYDFAVECQACQAKLQAAQADLADEKAKGQAVSRERDDALRAAKGGSALRIWCGTGISSLCFSQNELTPNNPRKAHRPSRVLAGAPPAPARTDLIKESGRSKKRLEKAKEKA